jgi:pseudaminic acid synthase
MQLNCKHIAQIQLPSTVIKKIFKYQEELCGTDRRCTIYTKKAYTPWEWHKGLKKEAEQLGMDLFSSPFDITAVDYLEDLNMPAYKIASCEITDHILIKKIAQTKKPVIISSGNASIEELQEAVDLLRANGTTDICMLKCTAAYPAKKEDANLLTINDMINRYNVIGGLSDHTLGDEVPTLSVAMGARVIEKHFTLSRDSGSPDDAFSLTPLMNLKKW